MAGESTTRCGSANNTSGGFEGEAGDVLVTSERLVQESPADGWKDCAGLQWASLPLSCKPCFFDFPPAEVVPKWPNGGIDAWVGGGGMVLEFELSVWGLG